MRPPQPPLIATTTARRRPWLGVIASVLIHGTIVSIVLWSEARPDFFLRPQADSVELASRRARAISMVYLPPPAPSRVDGRERTPQPHPIPSPVTPPPPPPDKEADHPPAKGDEGARSPEDNVPADGGSAAPTVIPDGYSPPIPPTEAPRRHIPSIAFRGGQPGSEIARTEQSPMWQSPPTLAGSTPRCIPGPTRSASDPIDWGIVRGRVYRLGSSDPLPGATLQVLGTNYTTVSDANGDYTLRFDAWPLRNCQEEYVRVQMDGFVTQTLNLTIGITASSDVQLRGR